MGTTRDRLARLRPAAAAARRRVVAFPWGAARRFVLLQALMLWQGGFLFYVTFVVPTGTAVLGSAAAQGVITRRVTDALNGCGVAGLALLALELALTRDPVARRTAARWWLFAFAAFCQYCLFTFHLLLDAFMDPTGRVVVIAPPFYPVHRMYLWASTLQWAAGLALAWLTLRAWASEDGGGGQSRPG